MFYSNTLRALTQLSDMTTTSVKLLHQLRDPTATHAWERFIDLYTPLLFQWTCQRGLEKSDAADLVQDVILTVLQRISDFDPNGPGRFRSWLKTIAANRITDFYRRRKSRRETELNDNLFALADISEADLWDDLSYQQSLVRRALELLRSEFQDVTWQAGYAQLVENRTAAETARDLGISVNAAYIAKSRLLARLRDELDDLLR